VLAMLSFDDTALARSVISATAVPRPRGQWLRRFAREVSTDRHRKSDAVRQ